jgi:hypothetical protein
VIQNANGPCSNQAEVGGIHSGKKKLEGVKNLIAPEAQPELLAVISLLLFNIPIASYPDANLPSKAFSFFTGRLSLCWQ